MILVLAGGSGGPKLAAGIAAVVPPHEVTVIGNTGDDLVLHGLHISPDLDSLVYRLAGALDADKGWGLSGETWRVMEALERYGGESWFGLGDLDLATHLYRTQRLATGAPLSVVTDEITRAWGVGVRVLPMSDDRVETRVTVDEGEVSFQRYFVGLRHDVPVRAVRFEGAASARPAPGLLDAVAAADRIVIGPSNPLVSIGPILAVPGIRDALADRRADVIAVSPLVGGRALKGPADRMLRELGQSATAAGVARLYRDVAATLVVDEADAADAETVAGEDVECVVAPTVMHDATTAAALGRLMIGVA